MMYQLNYEEDVRAPVQPILDLLESVVALISGILTMRGVTPVTLKGFKR